MGSSARRPRLPKRSVIERLTQKGPECLPEMMSLLSCFKEYNFNEARCQNNMRMLSECVSRQPPGKKKQKSTVFYHLKRLYYTQRR